MNHMDRITLPHGCTDERRRYTMTDPEHPECLTVRQRIMNELCGGGPPVESVTLTRAESLVVVWLIDEYYRLAVTIDTTAAAVRKLRDLRAALRIRRGTVTP